MRCGAVWGQSLVEFALIVPIFFTLLFGVFEVARLMAVWIALQQGAQEAARVGSIKSKTEADMFLAAQNATALIGSGLRDCTPGTNGSFTPSPISDPTGNPDAPVGQTGGGSCLPTTTAGDGRAVSPDGAVSISCGAAPTKDVPLATPGSCRDASGNRISNDSNSYVRVEITYPFHPMPIVYPFGALQLQSWAQVRVE